MTGINESLANVQALLHRVWSSPLRTLLLLLVLGVGVFAGFFLKTLGEQTAQVTVEVLKSGAIARLAPSRITPLSYRVAVLNRAVNISDSEVKNVVSALQKQVHNDFAPIWGVDAELTFVAKDKEPDSRSWWLEILDKTDETNSIAYHDVTSAGLPLGKVFTAEASKGKYSWSVLASQELLDILLDPRLNLSVIRFSEDGNDVLYAYEVTPPCQDEKYAYSVDGVLVSDFVTPAWFDASAKLGKSRFDFRNEIGAPFTILAGGWASVAPVTSKGWTLITK